MENNVQKMREALEKLDKLLYVGCDGHIHEQPDTTDEIERTIKAALAAPLRNCDRLKAFDDFIAAWNRHVTSRKSVEEPMPSIAGFLYWLSSTEEKGDEK